MACGGGLPKGWSFDLNRCLTYDDVNAARRQFDESVAQVSEGEIKLMKARQALINAAGEGETVKFADGGFFVKHGSPAVSPLTPHGEALLKAKDEEIAQLRSALGRAHKLLSGVEKDIFDLRLHNSTLRDAHEKLAATNDRLEARNAELQAFVSGMAVPVDYRTAGGALSSAMRAEPLPDAYGRPRG